MLEDDVKARLAKLETQMEYLKDWVESEFGNYVRQQEQVHKDLKSLSSLIQGKGDKPGVLETLRNIQSQQNEQGIKLKKFGIIFLSALGSLHAGSELGAFKALLSLLG